MSVLVNERFYRDVDLHDYLRVLRKSWLLIIIFAIVGVGVAGLYSLLKAPTYTSVAKVVVNTSVGASASDLQQGSSFALARVATYVDLVQTPAVLNQVIKKLSLSVTPAELANDVSASSPLNTTLIQITANSNAPLAAANIANATATSLIAVVQNVEATSAQVESSPVKLTQVQDGVAPATASSPKIMLNFVLGLLVGLVVGVAAGVLREVLDTRVRSADDVAQLSDAPAVGGILFDPKSAFRPLLVREEPFSVRAEAYRTLRTNLQFLNVEGEVGGRSFVITSSLEREGKSVVTANLAISLAASGSRVLVVDADLRRPKIASYFGLESAAGLTNLLVGHYELPDLAQKAGEHELYVLASGRVPPNPSELLGSARMKELIELFSSNYDYVLFDSPPLLPVTDAAVLTKAVGGALLVVASGQVTRQQVGAAVKSLDHVDARLAGIVVTRIPERGPYAYGHGAYGYYYGEVRASAHSGVRGHARPDAQADST